MVLLEAFHGVFAGLSFVILGLLMFDWILSHRHRFVTDRMISNGFWGDKIVFGRPSILQSDQLEDPANRVPWSESSPAPMAMVLYSLTLLLDSRLYSQHGHQQVQQDPNYS
ncbi:MAG: hypothetical protein U0795_02995 [Pirellulales bacterium]